MRSLCALILILAPLANAAGATTKGQDASFLTSSLPYPFAPPSDDFCSSNTLGDDAYVSVFVPCDFVFYETNAMPEHFSCDGYGKSTAIVKKEQRKIVMWPESCVAAGPRCYSIEDNPTLYNYTLFNETEFGMVFPERATVVSVDCTADFAKVNQFIENLPEELADVAASISFAAGVFLFAVIAAIVACICCCFGACRRNRHSSPEATYMAVPSHVVKAQPVQGTTVYGAQPIAKEMV